MSENVVVYCGGGGGGATLRVLIIHSDHIIHSDPWCFSGFKFMVVAGCFNGKNAFLYSKIEHVNLSILNSGVHGVITSCKYIYPGWVFNSYRIS